MPLSLPLFSGGCSPFDEAREQWEQHQSNNNKLTFDLPPNCVDSCLAFSSLDILPARFSKRPQQPVVVNYVARWDDSFCYHTDIPPPRPAFASSLTLGQFICWYRQQRNVEEDRKSYHQGNVLVVTPEDLPPPEAFSLLPTSMELANGITVRKKTQRPMVFDWFGREDSFGRLMLFRVGLCMFSCSLFLMTNPRLGTTWRTWLHSEILSRHLKKRASRMSWEDEARRELTQFGGKSEVNLLLFEWPWYSLNFVLQIKTFLLLETTKSFNFWKGSYSTISGKVNRDRDIQDKKPKKGLFLSRVQAR